VAIGCGDLPISRVVRVLGEVESAPEEFRLVAHPQKRTETGGEVTVMGLKGVLYQLAKCCNPAPGDPIVGYITRGKGVTIHRQDCPNILSVQDKGRLLQVSWGVPTSSYPVPVRIKAYDRENLMRDIALILSDEGVNLENVRVVQEANTYAQVVIDLVLGVRDIEQLSRVLTRIENLTNVVEVFRNSNG
jgi:(p)ppGpp synthase/HD superfamily hydrolase